MEVAASLESDDATSANRAQAVAQYRQACDWGHTPACIRAGHRLKNGKDVTHDQRAAVELFRTACESGGPEGCNMLGIMYASGEGGLSTDIVRARQLYLRACSEGWAWGCYNLAKRMRDGEGGEQDMVGAATHFDTACSSGIADACNLLGNMYWNGKGESQNQLRANMYYTKGCDGDTAWACYNLGTSYRNGTGVLAKDELNALYTGGLNPLNFSSFLNMTGSWVWTVPDDGGPPESWGYTFERQGSMVMTGCKYCDSRAFAVRQRRE